MHIIAENLFKQILFYSPYYTLTYLNKHFHIIHITIGEIISYCVIFWTNGFTSVNKSVGFDKFKAPTLHRCCGLDYVGYLS